MRSHVITLTLLLCLSARAAGSVADYAFEAPLGDSDGQLQRVLLPVDVVLDLTQADLGDVAVFSAEDRPLPHVVVQAGATVRGQTKDLPFHEFSRFLQARSRIVTRRAQDDSGMTLETTETLPIEARRTDYLVEIPEDVGELQLDRIELDWRHQPVDQMLELRVEAGRTIDTLAVIMASKRLTNLESNDVALRSLTSLPAAARYLRLTAVDPATGFELLQVTGHYREIVPAPTLSHRLAPDLEHHDDVDYYAFEIPSRVPPRALQILPATPHSVIAGELYGGHEDFNEARRVQRDFRQHNIDDADIKPSEPIELTRAGYTTYWFSTREPLAAAPSVELLYPRYEVIFLGDGNGPYRLGWGNHAAGSERGRLEDLLEISIDQARERSTVVNLGPRQAAGGPERLVAEPALPWQKWLLWMLLVIAAVVTGRMALGLYQDMNTASSKKP